MRLYIYIYIYLCKCMHVPYKFQCIRYIYNIDACIYYVFLYACSERIHKHESFSHKLSIYMYSKKQNVL